MRSPRVVGIGGGIGAARLWCALAQVVDPQDLALVVNTGEDLWLHGLRICPDLDTTLYALSGRQDLERGWGVVDETWACRETLADLGTDTWFGLGDRDLAVHLFRTGRLRDGAGLHQVTADLAAALGVQCTVMPMTDHEVVTTIETTDGRSMHYQKFLVRGHATDAVGGVHYVGCESATPAPGVLDAIAAADVVVLGPSNPVASLGPVLAVPGIRSALAARREAVVVVTPTVSGVPIEADGERVRSLSRATLLGASGFPPSATGVAGYHRGLAGRFVLDRADAAEAPAIEALGYDVMVVPTLLHRGDPAEPLVEAVLTGCFAGAPGAIWNKDLKKLIDSH